MKKYDVQENAKGEVKGKKKLRNLIADSISAKLLVPLIAIFASAAIIGGFNVAVRLKISAG